MNGMWDGITFVYWNCVGNTIARIEDDTSSSTIGVKSQNSLNTNVEARNIEDFEHDLSHLLPVLLRVKRSLSH